MAMAGLAAVFWGSMGVAGQYLLQNCHFTPMDLISIRMLLAGSIFVGIEFFLLKKGALKVFETKQNIIDLIIYTLTIIGTQLTFFVCIQYANAPFAAVLTATVPLWIMIFMVVFQHKRLTVKEVFCGLVAVAGVVLVVTGGSFKNFNVSGIGFWAGIGSGITGAFYVLLPQKFIACVGSGLATSWALLLTGVTVTLFSHFLERTFGLDRLLNFGLCVYCAFRNDCGVLAFPSGCRNYPGRYCRHDGDLRPSSCNSTEHDISWGER